MTTKHTSIQFRTLYGPHDPTLYATDPGGHSLTSQEFAEECDINFILEKYKRTGMLTHVNKTQGQFGDFTSISDYQTSLNKIMEAHENFELLPSDLRSKFDNDPAKLIDFINNEKNYDDCVKYGLIIPKHQEPTIQEHFEKALENNDKKRSSKQS